MANKNHSVVIRGSFGHGNFGDDLLMICALRIAQSIFPLSKILISVNSVDMCSELIPNNFLIHRSSVKESQFDIVIYGGGTQFYSFPLTGKRKIVTKTLPTKIFRLGLRNFYRLVEVIQNGSRTTESTNNRLIAIGLGLGPFVPNCKHKKRVMLLLESMAYIATRDPISFDLSRSCNPDNSYLKADLCFLGGLWISSKHMDTSNTKIEKITRVGVIVRDWNHTVEGNSYNEALMDAVGELRDRGIEVTYILFQKTSDTNWSERLMRKNEEVIAWDPESITISEFLDTLAGFDLFITSRFHGAISSAIVNKPVICIEIEQKLRMVSELLENGARLWSHPFDKAQLHRLFSELEGNYSSAVKNLDDVVQEQSSLVDELIEDCKKNNESA